VVNQQSRVSDRTSSKRLLVDVVKRLDRVGFSDKGVKWMVGGVEYVFSFLLDGGLYNGDETSEWNVCAFEPLLHVLSIISEDADDACVAIAVICLALYSYHRTHKTGTESRIYFNLEHRGITLTCPPEHASYWPSQIQHPLSPPGLLLTSPAPLLPLPASPLRSSQLIPRLPAHTLHSQLATSLLRSS
jgi:hypothetical protein